MDNCKKRSCPLPTATTTTAPLAVARRSVSQQRIQNGEQLVHAGRHGGFLGLASLDETFVEGFDDRIEAHSAEHSQIQGGTHNGATAPNAAVALQAPAVTVERGDADQLSDLLVTERAQFRQVEENVPARTGPTPGTLRNKSSLSRPERAGLDGLSSS